MTCRGIGCVWMQDALSIPLLSFSPPPLYHNHPPHVHLPWMSPHLPASLSQYIKPPPHITSPTCLVQTCQNLSKLVQTRPNSSKLVQTCPNLSKLVQTCPNSSKLVQTCPNSSKLVLAQLGPACLRAY